MLQAKTRARRRTYIILPLGGTGTDAHLDWTINRSRGTAELRDYDWRGWRFRRGDDHKHGPVAGTVSAGRGAPTNMTVTSRHGQTIAFARPDISLDAGMRLVEEALMHRWLFNPVWIAGFDEVWSWDEIEQPSHPASPEMLRELEKLSLAVVDVTRRTNKPLAKYIDELARQLAVQVDERGEPGIVTQRYRRLKHAGGALVSVYGTGSWPMDLRPPDFWLAGVAVHQLIGALPERNKN